MTLGTILFWSVSRSLAVRRVSAPLYQIAVPTRAGHFDRGADTCRLATCAHSLQCSSDEQLSSLVSRFEAQVRRLEVLAPHFSAYMTEEDSRSTREDSSQAEEAIITAVAVFFIFIIKIVGLVLLNDALDRISQRQSTRAIAFGIIGANIGAFWAVSGSAAMRANGGEGMWDHVMLLCFLGLDVGCILGGVMAFGKTAG